MRRMQNMLFPYGAKTRSRALSGITIVVLQSPTEPFLLLDRSRAPSFRRNDQYIPNALVITLGVIVLRKGMTQMPELTVAEENKSAQAFRAYRPNKALRIRIQVGAARWKSHRLSS